MELLIKSLEFVLWFLIRCSHLNGVTNVKPGLLLRSVPRLRAESSHLAISSGMQRVSGMVACDTDRLAERTRCG
jgi:hypothetical protein